jgi:hypothetical protein
MPLQDRLPRTPQRGVESRRWSHVGRRGVLFGSASSHCFAVSSPGAGAMSGRDAPPGSASSHPAAGCRVQALEPCQGAGRPSGVGFLALLRRVESRRWSHVGRRGVLLGSASSHCFAVSSPGAGAVSARDAPPGSASSHCFAVSSPGAGAMSDVEASSWSRLPRSRLRLLTLHWRVADSGVFSDAAALIHRGLVAGVA